MLNGHTVSLHFLIHIHNHNSTAFWLYLVIRLTFKIVMTFRLAFVVQWGCLFHLFKHCVWFMGQINRSLIFGAFSIDIDISGGPCLASGTLLRCWPIPGCLLHCLRMYQGFSSHTVSVPYDKLFFHGRLFGWPSDHHLLGYSSLILGCTLWTLKKWSCIPKYLFVIMGTRYGQSSYFTSFLFSFPPLVRLVWWLRMMG